MSKPNELNLPALDEARAAKTSPELTAAIQKITDRIYEMQNERAMLSRALQDAILFNKDQAKAAAALEAHDTGRMTLEAAVAAFNQRRDGMLLDEAQQQVESLTEEHLKLSAELYKAAQDFAERGREMREAGAKLAALTSKHYQVTSKIEGRTGKVPKKPSSVVREAIGWPTATKAPGYAGRLDHYIVQALVDNPFGMRRAQNMRRGRLGETNATKDMVGAGYVPGAAQGAA